MLGSLPAMGFVPSTDLDRSRQFFEGTLGLVVEDANPGAVVIRTGGTTLRVTRVKELNPQPFTIFGWQVPDITAATRGLAAAGAAVQHYGFPEQDGDGVWTAPNGDRVTWFTDPDANILSLTQFA